MMTDFEKKLTAREKKLLEGSSHQEALGWNYLRIVGEPYRRGFQHGFLLGEKIREHIDKNFKVAWFDTGNKPEFFYGTAERLWLDLIDDEFIEELQGIVDGVNRCESLSGKKPVGEYQPLTLSQLLAWNAFEELLYSWWPLEFANHNKNFFPRKSSEHCSAFIATGDATKSGETVVAHETWSTYMFGAPQNLILDIQPEKGNQILMQGIFGYIYSGSDFFITDNGIMGTETTMGGGFQGYDENGTPLFYRARKAMQYAESIDHWISIMKEQNNGGIANSWLLGTTDSNEIVRFELGLKFINIEKKDNYAFYGNNVATDPRIRNQECNDTQLYYDIRDSGSRHVRWIQLMGNLDKPEPFNKNPITEKDKKGEYYGKVDVENAMKMLGDHHDIYLFQKAQLVKDKEERKKLEKEAKNHPCGHTLCSHLDMDPADPLSHAGQPPFYPWGSIDGKVVDAQLAGKMSFAARRGHPCGMPFDHNEFLEKHPQYNWLEGILESMPANDWAFCQKDHKPTKYPPKELK
ncbi:MAG: phospholipase [Candidatus Aminicenantes bacterium]|nr:MAG: phospholipase [Candidatus Aminicenantes bacterium]